MSGYSHDDALEDLARQLKSQFPKRSGKGSGGNEYNQAISEVMDDFVAYSRGLIDRKTLEICRTYIGGVSDMMGGQTYYIPKDYLYAPLPSFSGRAEIIGNHQLQPEVEAEPETDEFILLLTLHVLTQYPFLIGALEKRYGTYVDIRALMRLIYGIRY